MRQSKLNKTILIVVILFASVPFSFGQKTEINFNAYTGLFSFRGNGSAYKTWLNVNPYSFPNKYTSNVYGRKSEFSYAFEIQGQHVTKRKKIIGSGLSFEALTSKVNIDTLAENGFIYWQHPASGKTTLKNTFITLNPFIGQRYSYRKATFDVLAGCDLAFCLKSKEAGKASTDNKDFVKAENDKAKPLIDFRPRIQIKMEINKIGFLAGYSAGLTNYQSENNLKAYTRFLRLGLSYQLK